MWADARSSPARDLAAIDRQLAAVLFVVVSVGRRCSFSARGARSAARGCATGDGDGRLAPPRADAPSDVDGNQVALLQRSRCYQVHFSEGELAVGVLTVPPRASIVAA